MFNIPQLADNLLVFACRASRIVERIDEVFDDEADDDYVAYASECYRHVGNRSVEFVDRKKKIRFVDYR